MDDLYTIKDTKSYKRFVINQRLAELAKAIKRQWSQERQDQIDNLKKDLENS